MLFIALASATMQHYAMIILIPFMCTHDHSSIQSYEIGILIAAATAGELISRRFTEPSISKLGTRYAIQLGFFLMVVGSFAFWLVSYITNDSNFTSLAFLARFIFGCGSGLLRSIVIVAHALSKKSDQTMQAKDYLRFNFIGESFGYFLGPLVMVLTNHSRWENERTCMWFATEGSTYSPSTPSTVSFTSESSLASHSGNLSHKDYTPVLLIDKLLI